MKYFRASVRAAMNHDNITQQELSDKSKIKRSLISKLLGDSPPKTLSEDLLCALCNCWPEKRTGLLILEAHLKDEIERAGCSLDEIHPHVTGERPNPILDRDLATIQAFLDKDNDLRTVIAMTAQVVRDYNKPSPRKYAEPEPEALKVAEEPQTGGYKHPLLGPPPPREIRNKELDKRTLISGD